MPIVQETNKGYQWRYSTNASIILHVQWQCSYIILSSMLQLDARTQVKDYRDKIDEPHNARFQGKHSNQVG